MQLDFIPHINEFGENIVRLYDFDKAQSIQFRQVLEDWLIAEPKPLDFSTIEFIEPRNCNLILRLAYEDEGIRTANNKTFYCDLTMESYQKMIKLLTPFCTKETIGYQWLYDVDTLTDFLYSPAGSW